MSSHESTPKPPRVVSLADEAGVQQLVFNSLLSLWEVVNNLTRLRPSKRQRYRVTIFGSARATPDSQVYHEVKKIATALAQLDCDIITGGGPGLMAAANEGADVAQVRERSVSLGIRVELPFEQQANPFVEQAFLHKTFFTRLHHFVLASDAFIVAPGGIGTLLEATMIWQLLQVRHVQDVPLVFVGEMWRELVEWARRHMLAAHPPHADSEDLLLPRCVRTAEEAVEVIRREHSLWLHSDAP